MAAYTGRTPEAVTQSVVLLMNDSDMYERPVPPRSRATRLNNEDERTSRQ